MKITFLGAAEQVTGSKYLIEHEATKMLVDCGLFQGKDASKHNWKPLPVDAATIDAIVLTHAHLDHTGYIPLLVKKGFKGKIYCSGATYEVAAIILKDSGFVQEMDAKKSNSEHAFSGGYIAPLYTEKEAENSLQFFQVVDYDTLFSIGSLTVKLIRSGHVLGSSFVIISDGKQTLSFSGDLGRPQDLIMKSPPHLVSTNYLVLESTYGNTLHDKGDPQQALGAAIKTVVDRHGILIIPAFALERTQVILYHLYLLKQSKAIPADVPIFLDSPMAERITELFCAFSDEHKIAPGLCEQVFSVATFLAKPEDSKRLNNLQGPAIIIAGSGMADGGRVLYHFAHFISDPKNMVLFVGFQAPGTHGRDLIDGARQIHIEDQVYDVAATISIIKSFSAHADYGEILDWLSFFKQAPQKVFLTHGELASSESLQKKIEERFGWSVVIPKQGQSFELS